LLYNKIDHIGQWRVFLLEKILKKLNPEKRDKIINSALDEFGRNSYEKASTNNIVKNAGISKGLLFHYFKNKKELYDHLENFVFKKMVDVILDETDFDETDIFNRIRQIAIIKMRVLARYPGLETFAKALYDRNSISDIREKVEEMVPDIYHQIYVKNIDMSQFKEGLDYQKAIKIIQWTIEKYGEEHISLIKKTGSELEYAKIVSGIDPYLDILRKAFCKKGEMEND